MNNNCNHKEVFRIKPLNPNEELYYFCGCCKEIININDIPSDVIYLDCMEDDKSKYLKTLHEGNIEKNYQKAKFLSKFKRSNKRNI